MKEEEHSLKNDINNKNIKNNLNVDWDILFDSEIDFENDGKYEVEYYDTKNLFKIEYESLLTNFTNLKDNDIINLYAKSQKKFLMRIFIHILNQK